MLWIFIVGFITNFIWENAQAPLYEGHESFSQHFLFCLVASIIDGVVIVGFYLIISTLRKNFLWLENIKITDILILLFLGSVTAIIFEVLALKIQTWNYTDRMPLIYGLGLMPLIQLSILSVLSIYLVRTLQIIFVRKKLRD